VASTPASNLLMNRLTPKQRQFAQLVASGATYTDSYRQVYSDRGKNTTTRCEASRLANLPKMAEEIDRLLQPPVEPQQVAIQALLTEARYGETSRDRQSALKTLGRMARLL
jgi:phage terminase small subunit